MPPNFMRPRKALFNLPVRVTEDERLVLGVGGWTAQPRRWVGQATEDRAE